MSTVYTFGPFRLDANSGILFRGADPVGLGARAVALLRVLATQPGVPVSKDALIEAAWPGLAVTESNLPVQIAALRRVLGEEPGGERWIETLPRRGYRYIGPVVSADPDGFAHSPPAASSDAGAMQPSPDLARPRRTDRRHLTMMSCELVGSAAPLAPIELEDLRDILDAYHRCVAETVERFAGFVAKRIGNVALVGFGYPTAHEDDAEQAVLAGLELCATVKTPSSHTDATWQCRIGIAAGLVIVSDSGDLGSTREYDLIGEAVNLSARLQEIAQANTVVVADDVRKLLGNLFEFQNLGPRDLNGIDPPVRSWSVLRASSVESRFEALHADGLTALVGRQEETELLLRRWSRAKSGAGQVVLLGGEPGIGKSRLTDALLQRVAEEPFRRLRYFCSPQHTDSALYPIIDLMERGAALSPDDTPQARLDKLAAVLARTATSIEDAALLAELLSLPNDGRYAQRQLTPEQRRQKTLDALIAQIPALARQSPVLMVFEDAHWSDPTSLEVLGRVVDRIMDLRVLLIVTFRPEFEAPWIGRPHVTALTLNRLTEREVDAMIDRVVGSKLLPASIRREIVERTDGIPLFVEEMTKSVLEAEGEGAAQLTAAAGSPPTLAVPASLHASLMARLDRLGSAKEAAQIGAAIGREFSHALLAAVTRQPQAHLGAALDRLIAAGLLFRQGTPPHASYLFKHALVQDAAYGALLREPRRALHARIAETLETEFAEIAENQPELLARHCTEAGLTEKAAGLWGKAGQRSLERSALAEAVEQLTRAVGQIAALPATPMRRQQQIKLQVALINPLHHLKGFAAPETKAAAERARLLIEQAEALGEPPENPLLLFSVLYGFWVTNLGGFNGDALHELAAQFLSLAEKRGDTVPLMVGHRLMGISLMCAGNMTEARAHLDRALALYDPAEHLSLTTHFGLDTGVSILIYRSWALWLLGYPAAALRDADDALSNAREIGQAATQMSALFRNAILHMLCGNYSVATARVQELFVLAEEKDASQWKAAGMVVEGCALALTGKASDAIPIITSGITAWRSTGATLYVPLYLAHLGRTHAERGKVADAWRCLDEAMAAMETTKEKWCEAEIHRIAGEIALISPDPDVTKAEEHFQHALAVARAQQAKSWELRAAMSLARLWHDQDKRQPARNVLAPVYLWFTEGFDTLDLKDAKSLLDRLDA
jgi:class 3 adenylate cyclase/predicted ATPase